MKSFSKKLVLNYTGVIFLSFLMVYILFNVTIRAYIRSEADREFNIEMYRAMNIAYNPALTRARLYGHEAGMQIIPRGNINDFEFISPIAPILPHDTNVWVTQHMPNVELWFDAPTPDVGWRLVTEEDINIGINLFQPVAVRVSESRSSIINTELMVLDHDNAIILTSLPDLDNPRRVDMQFLADYYLANTARFSSDEMVRVVGTWGTYYMRAVPHTTQAVSVLLHSDISSAIAFMNNMNQRLGLLLAFSGILSLITTLIMSARFKRTINRLCKYSETIGRGNFNESPGDFKDSEFNQLSISMNNMSNMLQAYETNQKQFFENASHELRTPLMSIKGYAEGILEDIFTKEEAAQIILHEGQKMTDLVNGLLYMSRLDSGAEIPQALPALDIKNLLYDCLERVKPIAQNFDKEISMFVPPGAAMITADEDRLERAIINILSNAIRHAKNEVQVSCHVSENNLEIIIQDDGDGINPDDLPHIFKRFYKGENGNTGLGLAISRDIVESLKGRIVAQNLTGQRTGAAFTITLPVCAL
ncbi:MAG: HAMP domain-containing histidine kinase [Defluviitaleaceae bacterium]|nr:HAMP domain-containing histidine kinase [Defluviitaleaceae bacterium]